jgi:hypothetical protein
VLWVRTDNLPMPREHYFEDEILLVRNVEREAAGKYACIATLNGKEVTRVNFYLEVTGNKNLSIILF